MMSKKKSVQEVPAFSGFDFIDDSFEADAASTMFQQVLEAGHKHM